MYVKEQRHAGLFARTLYMYINRVVQNFSQVQYSSEQQLDMWTPTWYLSRAIHGHSPGMLSEQPTQLGLIAMAGLLPHACARNLCNRNEPLGFS
jgi:hypothetical protein